MFFFGPSLWFIQGKLLSLSIFITFFVNVHCATEKKQWYKKINISNVVLNERIPFLWNYFRQAANQIKAEGGVAWDFQCDVSNK